MDSFVVPPLSSTTSVIQGLFLKDIIDAGHTVGPSCEFFFFFFFDNFIYPFLTIVLMFWVGEDTKPTIKTKQCLSYTV